ncbi:neuropilin and tolloid-like protein 2, partial [Biomphalaria pfeifferi]
MFDVLIVIVALSPYQTHGDSTPSLSIGPPPMINDEIHPSCWNFTHGNWRIQEFYSPNFPGEYATDVDCVQYLQGECVDHLSRPRYPRS